MYYVDALLIRLLADNHPSAIAIRLARSSTEDLSQIRHSLNLLTNPYTHIYHIYTMKHNIHTEEDSLFQVKI